MLCLAAFRRLQQRRQEEIWLMGQYAALAVHAPSRLPPAPLAPPEPMTDDEMKQRLLAWRGKETA